MTLSLLAYLSDAWVLGTYALLARTGRARPFHWANALGAAPLLVIEVLTHAWPVMPLTGTFCLLGWWGLWRESDLRARRAARHYLARHVVLVKDLEALRGN